ncbi:transglutaminase family protein [Psychrobacter sp. HD31]|uniref:transglutaminase-like domain-containing protein n=1 Tax=Psychrobacter sp. HD31 TaxID=3112003 RepID=UPI003DA47542
MTIKLTTTSALAAYLESSKVIDFDDAQIQTMAKKLANGLSSDIDIAKSCFEFVLNKIEHSVDYKRNGKSCRASDVLQLGHGFCYAKSHLLVALLRANNIPAGLCYQRLVLSDEPNENGQFEYCLHGLAAVYLPKVEGLKDNNGWYRVDPRGNKAGIFAKFDPPTEQLAYPITHVGEQDFSQVFAEPLSCVVSRLSQFEDYQELTKNLPDLKTLI